MDNIDFLLLVALFSSFLVSVLSISLGRTLEKYIFFILNSSVFAWCLSMFFFQISHSEKSVIFTKVIYLMPIFIVHSFLIFLKLFFFKQIRRIEIFSIVFCTFIFSHTILFTEYLVKNVVFTSDSSFKFEFGIFYYVYIFLICTEIIWSIRLIFIQSPKLASKLEKNILSTLTFAFLCPSFLSLIFNLFLPTIGIFKFIWVGQVSTIFWTFTILFLIIKYDFLGIKLYAGKIIYYLIISIFPFISFLIIANSFDRERLSLLSTYLFLFTISYLFSYLFINLNNFIKANFTSRLINPGFNPTIEVNIFSKLLSKKVDLEEILDLTLTFLQKTINTSPIILLYKKNDKIKTFQANTSKINFLENPELIFNFAKTFKTDLLDIDKIKFHNLRKVEEFENLGIKLIKKISLDETNSLILVLGQKPNPTNFNNPEIEFLKSITEILEAGIDRAHLYEEVKALNTNLEEKVKIATSELEEKNQKLEESLRKEKDMMDILGHELRTPLGTARNAVVIVDSILNKPEAPNLDLVKNYIKIAVENIRREKEILQTILASTKLENGKLEEVNLVVFEIDDLLEDSFKTMLPDSEQKKLNLKLENLVGKTKVNSDRALLQQVLDNLVSNAIKYTKEGEVIIKAEPIDATILRISVIDTGEGVSEEDLQHIGKKFFRANAYSGSSLGKKEIQRPGGTGIGLYVVKGLLESLGSKLEIQTKLNVGSKFYFDLKIFKENE